MSSVDLAVDREASPPEVKKVRLMSITEMPPATNLHSNSIVFAKSGDDEDAVNMITKYFNDFSKLGQEQGFTLSILNEEHCGTTVRLVESSSDFNSRKAFRAMDALIECKSGQDEKMDKELKKIRKKLTKQKQRQDKINEEIGGKMENLSKEKDDLSKEVARIKSVVKNLQNAVVKNHQNSVVKDTVYERFFREPYLSTKYNNELLDQICKFLEACSKGSLFERTIAKKRKRLAGYITFLQTSVSGGTEYNLYMATLFYHMDMMYRPTEEEKIHARKRINSKNAVGSIHYIAFKKGNMCLAIMDKKIVNYAAAYSGGDVLSLLHGCLETESKWTGNFKFFTIEKVRDDSNVFFVPASSAQEEICENEKVVKWIKNNFKCLKWPIMNGHEAAFVGLYNLCHQYVFNSGF